MTKIKTTRRGALSRRSKKRFPRFASTTSLFILHLRFDVISYRPALALRRHLLSLCTCARTLSSFTLHLRFDISDGHSKFHASLELPRFEAGVSSTARCRRHHRQRRRRRRHVRTLPRRVESAKALSRKLLPVGQSRVVRRSAVVRQQHPSCLIHAVHLSFDRTTARRKRQVGGTMDI